MVASLRDAESGGGTGGGPGEFPPSPDGGFIEGKMELVIGSRNVRRFHHLQMVASLRG